MAIYTAGGDQWVNLGNFSNVACIVNADCSDSGATVVAWLKFDSTNHKNKKHAVLSSYAYKYGPGFSIVYIREKSGQSDSYKLR